MALLPIAYGLCKCRPSTWTSPTQTLVSDTRSVRSLCWFPLLGYRYLLLLDTHSCALPLVATDGCHELQANENQTCVSYIGHVSGSVIGLDDTLDTLNLIDTQMNSGAITANTGVSVLFLGTQLSVDTPGYDNLPPAIYKPEANDEAVPEDNNFTVMGAALVTALVVGFVGMMFIIVRRRRRSVKALEAHTELKDDGEETSEAGERSEAGEKSVSSPPPSRKRSEDYLDGNDLPDSPDDFGGSEYKFDMGGWMKSELLGIHGNAAITATLSRDYDAASDSDADSWAQTEGTIGSLELRLDPIEAEV